MAEPTIQLGNGNWAGKSDSLLGFSIQNGRFYEQEFTFSRSTSGTRVNSSGLIETAEILGNELVTNGTFSGVANGTDVVTLSGWGTYGSVTSRNIESEQLKLVSPSGTTNVGVVLSVSTTSGGLYRFTYSASGDLGINGIYIDAVGGYNTSTEQDITFTAPSSTTYIYFRTGANNGGTAYFDNISVKEAFQVNIPRVDYLNNSNGSLILEPQSTNLITYSEDFSNSYWAKSSVTLTSGFAAPDGSNNAYKIQGTINTSYIGRLISDTNQRSIYAKTVSGTANVNLLGDNSGFTITEDWQRFEYNPTSNTYNFAVDFRNGTNTTEVLIWGYQSEALSYPTSYIPTSGSSVTRNADACTDGGDASRFNDSEGVLYAEIASLEETSSSSKYISISDETYNNRLSILFSSGATNQIRAFLRVGGVSQVDFNGSVTDVTDYNKVAFKYKDNDFSLWINGVEVATDTSGSTFSANTLTKLSFSEINTTSGKFEGKVKDLKVYNTALSDSELATLTGGTSTVYNWVDSSSNRIINENGDTIIFT